MAVEFEHAMDSKTYKLATIIYLKIKNKMENRIFKGVLFLAAVTLVMACNPKQETPVTVAPVIDKEAIKQEIQAKENAYAELYNTGVLKDINYYADDATTFYQHRAPLVGKAAIIEFLKSDLQDNTNKITFTTKEVFVSNDGNQVVEVGAYSVFDSLNTPINTGNYMSLFEKRDGQYVSLRDMSASDMTWE